MHRTQLPITALPAWSKLNDVSFFDINVQQLGAKGFGLSTSRALTSKEIDEIPTLLLVPHDLVLSREAIEEQAKVDQHFKQLLDAAGGKSVRGDIILFLLMQITIASSTYVHNIGLSNPWTEYVKMLPGYIPVPTMWSEEERIMLIGTSLETALNAKMGALLGELETLREKTALIPWCQKCWWENEDLCLDDWLLLDAWFRSRSLELPSTGEAMIPCIDMVNHSSEPNAYYELTADGGVTLLLRPDLKLNEGSEATISYGASKSEAEMLFSYGFTGWESSAPSLTLTLDISQDDPLAKAKVVAFAKPPVVSLYMEEGRVQWQSPFLHLLCLNEEDGLQFRVLQQTDGSRSHLRVFWQGTDVTDATAEFESLTRDHELKDVFQLRAVTVLLERIEGQLERVYESEETVQALASLGLVAGNDSKAADALRLRKTETTILEAALAAVGLQKSKLMGSEVVLRYLGSMDDEERSEQGETNEEDFS